MTLVVAFCLFEKQTEEGTLRENLTASNCRASVHLRHTKKKKQTSERQEAAETLSSHAVTSTAAVHKVGPGNV